MELFDLEDFLYNRVNMSGWRLVDRDSDKVKDALQVMEKFHPIGASILSGGNIKVRMRLLPENMRQNFLNFLLNDVISCSLKIPTTPFWL